MTQRCTSNTTAPDEGGLDGWGVCCYQALDLIHMLRPIKTAAHLKAVSESQGAKHNPAGMLIACIWSRGAFLVTDTMTDQAEKKE